MRLAFAIAALLLVSCGGGSAVIPHGVSTAVQRPAQRYVAGNDIPPRFQWEGNDGYCGEVSMISAGLYYGQYTSQYEARALASPGVPQRLASSQLLLGVNAGAAAARMHLRAVAWHGGSPDAFLVWIKQQVAMGRPVAIGLFNNEYIIYGKKNPNAGFAGYDHIVPVTGVTSLHPLTSGAYYDSDTLTFSDNGLCCAGWYVKPYPNVPYTFTYDFGGFKRTRAGANGHKGPVYSLSSTAPNFGIAIVGVNDPKNETLPVRVATNVNYERPAIKNGTSARPKPMPLVLTVTVSGLSPGVDYNLYRYASFGTIPDARFNAAAKKAAQRWRIRIAAGSTYAFTQRIQSDDVAAYRAVRADGP